MVKTIIKTISVCLLLTSTAYGVTDDKFYAKMGVGLNQINPVRIQTNDLNGKIKLVNKFPLIQAGIGYHITDTIRTELSLDYYFLFLSNETSITPDNDIFNINYKTKISAAMISGYKDIVTLGTVTPFIGGGIGVSRLHDKATGNGKNSECAIFETLTPVSSQPTYRFAYKLTTGIDVKMTDTTVIGLSYNYLNLGHNKPRVSEGMNNMIGRDYLVHNLTASIRFNL
jgi:opacity protein-like surface antigen